jgi:hypothetical protein
MARDVALLFVVREKLAEDPGSRHELIRVKCWSRITST